jgi:hypothetical protein
MKVGGINPASPGLREAEVARGFQRRPEALALRRNRRMGDPGFLSGRGKSHVFDRPKACVRAIASDSPGFRRTARNACLAPSRGATWGAKFEGGLVKRSRPIARRSRLARLPTPRAPAKGCRHLNFLRLRVRAPRSDGLGGVVPPPRSMTRTSSKYLRRSRTAGSVARDKRATVLISLATALCYCCLFGSSGH